jgi:drug/metabolite transporter (DMT)-like permease
VTAPLLKRASEGAGAFATAPLLYVGAALVSLPALRRWREAGLRRSEAPWLLVVAASGAVLAPAALAWGLARTTAVTGSLLLNLEAVFTVGLAGLVHDEHVGKRVGGALLLMMLGGWHHAHHHAEPVMREHAHPHRHEGMEHEHAPDLHHRHEH